MQHASLDVAHLLRGAAFRPHCDRKSVHFYSTMLPNRNLCIPLKIKIGDRFYSTINRGLRMHRLRQKGCQAVPCLFGRKLFKTKNRGPKQVSRNRKRISNDFQPSATRIRASNSGYDGAGMFPAISRNLRSEN